MNNIMIPKQLQKEEFGFVKLLSRTKKPFEGGWQNKPYNFEQIQQWINNGNNYGVMGGYGGLIIVDADSIVIKELVEANLPSTFTVRSRANKRHFYYICPEIRSKIILDDRVEPSKLLEEEDHYGEIISFGSQVVGAGSIHPETNAPYEIVNDTEIATVTKKSILTVLAEFLPSNLFKVKNYEIEKETDINVFDVLRIFGLSIEYRGKQLQISHPIHGSVNGRNLVINKEKNIWHCFRHNSGGGPMSLIAVLEGIIDCSQAIPGGLRGENFIKTKKIADAKYRGDNFATITNETTEKYCVTSISDLLNEPDEKINWIVDNLLPASGFSIIVAKPKVGKSTLARQIALSVAKGEPFLERQTIKGPVLYVSLEEKRSEVKNHFRFMGATGEEDLGVYVGSTPEDATEWLEREIKQRKPILVIIDTLFRFARITDVNDYARVLSALDPLLALARTQSAHLMVVHHARKGGGEGGDKTLGSTAIFGSVDTAILLSRTDGRRTIETQQRYGTDMEATVLIFDPGTKTATLGETKENDDISKISESILEILKTKNEPLSEAAIDNEIEGRTTLKRKALRKLVYEQKIIRNGAGKRNDPYLYSCFLVPAIYGGQENNTNDIDNI